MLITENLTPSNLTAFYDLFARAVVNCFAIPVGLGPYRYTISLEDSAIADRFLQVNMGLQESNDEKLSLCFPVRRQQNGNWIIGFSEPWLFNSKTEKYVNLTTRPGYYYSLLFMHNKTYDADGNIISDSCCLAFFRAVNQLRRLVGLQ